MIPDPDKTLVDWAERDLRCFGDDLSREQAAVVLAMWSPMVKLRAESADAAAEVTALVLSRFPAELVPVKGVDFLPQVADRYCADCGHPEQVHGRLNCVGNSHTCPCYAFRLDGAW